jgi:uracil-DNA glycosylase
MPVYSKPSECAGCPLFEAPGPVFGIGDSRRAKLLYIAQNPGKSEVEARPMQPLVGPAGNVFNMQLGKTGIPRDSLFITNQVKCLTPNNREPSPKEIAHCKVHLDKELAACKADTVILAGAIPFKANIGHYSSISKAYKPSDSIFERMGCVEQRDGRKWIGTIHPAFVMRMPAWAEPALDHLRKAWLLADTTLPPLDITQHPTDEQILKAVDHICLQSREFADDVETRGLETVDEDDYAGADFEITMCGFGGKATEALVCTPDQVPLLEPIFRDHSIWCYEHNGEYDRYHIEKIIGSHNILGRRWDTMLGTHYLRSYAPKKLKPFCVAQYTWLPYYNRDLGKHNERLYNGLDVIATFQAAKSQQREMKQWQLEEVFLEFGMPLLPILEEIRRKGVNVDLKKALLFKKLTQQKIEKAEVMIAKVAGAMFNPYSPKQVKELLYERMRLPVQYIGRSGNYGVSRDAERKITTNYEARKSLRLWIEAGGEERKTQYKSGYILLQLLDFISGEKKKLEYIDRISGDGRIHANYKAHGTNTFRLSSSPNLQNVPVYDVSAWGGARREADSASEYPLDIGEEKEEAKSAAHGLNKPLGSLRSIVIPDHPEDLILTCDYEQLQLWLYAKQWNVRWLLDIFESREYIYGIVYEKLYKVPFFQEGKPRTKEYKVQISEKFLRRVKAVPLGFLFGRSAEAVGAEYGWETDKNKHLANHVQRRIVDDSCGHCLRDWWYGLNPELPESYKRIKYTLEQRGWIRHCFGQIMHYPTRKLTEGIASYAQSAEAFVVSEAMILIDRELKRREYKNTRLMLQVHDSLSLNIGGARENPTHMIEVAEEIVFPILGRKLKQLQDFQLRYSAEVSSMWDWGTTKYSRWKEETSGHISGRNVLESAPRS